MMNKNNLKRGGSNCKIKGIKTNCLTLFAPKFLNVQHYQFNYEIGLDRKSQIKTNIYSDFFG